MPQSDIDRAVGTLRLQIEYLLDPNKNNKYRREAVGVYEAMIRLAVVYTVQPETFRIIFSILDILPEGHKFVMLIEHKATPGERHLIARARAAAEAIQKARESSSGVVQNPLGPLLS